MNVSTLTARLRGGVADLALPLAIAALAAGAAYAGADNTFGPALTKFTNRVLRSTAAE